MFGINFLISYPTGGWFNVSIKDPYTGISVPDTPFIIQKSAAGVAFDFCPVPIAKKYNVIILRGTEEIYNNNVTISWPIGSPVEWVYA